MILAIVTLLIFLGTSLSVSSARAAGYPERPVTFIVPWPPGDLEDQLTRIIADQFTKTYHVPARVVNISGGGGVIGATRVANAKPDGYTIGSLVKDLVSTQIVNGHAKYDKHSLVPLGVFLTYPFALVTKKTAPYNDVAQLAAYAQRHDVVLGHFGYSALPTIATFKMVRRLRFSFSADATYDNLDCAVLKNGDVDVITTTMGAVLPCIKDIKLLAAYSNQPLSLFPSVKTLDQQVPGLKISLWNGLFVPRGTPPAIADKISTVARAAMQSPRAQKIARETGAEVYWLDGVAATRLSAEAYEESFTDKQ
ncbi:MAG: tripartite tricarboxylate transporter substrate binding protein [Hydrotalea sp.]|nr:tripartite tricarboxylate transporter substrate binding protein [Hydrotalea sp.]